MISWKFNDKVKQFRELSAKKYEEYLDGLKFNQLGGAKNNQENLDVAKVRFKQ